MMQNLLLEEGDIVNFKNVTLKRATFIKLRPQSKDFLDISNHKAVLERSLRSYTCLTVNDSILISYNDKRYFIDILDTKPQDAVSIVEVRRSSAAAASPFSPPAQRNSRTISAQLTLLRANRPRADGLRGGFRSSA